MNKAMKVGWKRLFIPMLAVGMLVLYSSPGSALTTWGYGGVSLEGITLRDIDVLSWKYNITASSTYYTTTIPDPTNLLIGPDVTVPLSSPGDTAWSSGSPISDALNTVTPPSTYIGPPADPTMAKASSSINLVQGTSFSAFANASVGDLSNMSNDTSWSWPYAEARFDILLNYNSAGGGAPLINITSVFDQLVMAAGAGGAINGSTYLIAVMGSQAVAGVDITSLATEINPDLIKAANAGGSDATGNGARGWESYWYGTVTSTNGVTQVYTDYGSDNRDGVGFDVTAPGPTDNHWGGTTTPPSSMTVAFNGSQGHYLRIVGQTLFGSTGPVRTVPEPGTLLLLGMGLFGVAVVRKRFGKK